MAQSRNGLADYLYRVICPDAVADVPDATLLDRFQASRDEAAFAELVRRHGPVVYGVCARVLSNAADAEDSFQATFIVLVRQVASIDRRRPLAGWLHTIAYRTALKVRLRRGQLLQLERRPPPMPPTEPSSEIDHREICAVLDEELQLLPAVERDLLILCDMQGRTQTEAATALQCPPGSVSRLLSGARERLRARLTRRGVGITAALLLALLAERGQAAVPARLNAEAVRVALLHVADTVAPPAASSGALELARQVMRDAFLSRVKISVVGLLAVTLTGVSVLAFGDPWTPNTPSDTPQAAVANQTAPASDVREANGPPVAPTPQPAARGLRHGGSVTALAVSPNSQQVASAGADRLIRVWNVETAQETVRINVPFGVTALAFSPDGSEVVAEDPKIGLGAWTVATGHRRKNLLGQGSGVECLTFSPDGKRLMTIGRNGHLVSLDFTKSQGPQRDPDWREKELSEKFWARFFWAPPKDSAPVGIGHAGAFTADSGTIIAVDRKLNLTRLNVQSGEVTVSSFAQRKVEGQSVTVVAVSANGGWLAWGNGDNRIGLLELSGNDPSSMFSAHEAPIVALAFTPDAHALASVDTDGWLIRSTLPNSDAKFASRKNSGRFRVRALAFAPDGKRLYGAGANGEVYCWDAITLDLIKPMLGK